MIRKADGTIEEFPEEAIGLPLGVVSGMSYEVLKRSLLPGETIVTEGQLRLEQGTRVQPSDPNGNVQGGGDRGGRGERGRSQGPRH